HPSGTLCSAERKGLPVRTVPDLFRFAAGWTAKVRAAEIGTTSVGVPQEIGLLSEPGPATCSASSAVTTASAGSSRSKDRGTAGGARREGVLSSAHLFNNTLAGPTCQKQLMGWCGTRSDESNFGEENCRSS